jgi:DNA repair ATPase RecN
MAAKKKKVSARKELRTPPSKLKQREGRGFSKAQLNRKSKMDGMSTMEWIKKNVEKVGDPKNKDARIRKVNANWDNVTQQAKKASKKKPARRKYK